MIRKRDVVTTTIALFAVTSGAAHAQSNPGSNQTDNARAPLEAASGQPDTTKNPD